MEQTLQLILKELQQLNHRVGSLESEFKDTKTQFGDMETNIESMKSQLDENTQLTKAVLHRQEETDAKLENLTFNHHKLHGDVTHIKETLQNIKGDIQFTYEKTSQNELEIYRIKKDQQFASIARER